MIITKGTLVQYRSIYNQLPRWHAWRPATFEVPSLCINGQYIVYGLAANDFDDTAYPYPPLAVVIHGYLRDVVVPEGETWSAGTVLWAGPYGVLTAVRPDAPFPQVFCALVIQFFPFNGTATLDVNVRPLPSITELTAVKQEEPENEDVLIFDSVNHYFVPRMLRWTDLEPVCHIKCRATLKAFPVMHVDGNGDIR